MVTFSFMIQNFLHTWLEDCKTASIELVKELHYPNLGHCVTKAFDLL